MEEKKLKKDSYSKEFKEDYAKLQNDNNVIDEFFENQINQNKDISKEKKLINQYVEEMTEQINSFGEKQVEMRNKMNAEFERYMQNFGVTKDVSSGVTKYYRSNIQIATLNDKNEIEFASFYEDLPIEKALENLERNADVKKFVIESKKQISSEKERKKLISKLEQMIDENELVKQYDALSLCKKLKEKYNDEYDERQLKYNLDFSSWIYGKGIKVSEVLNQKNSIRNKYRERARILKELNIGKFYTKYEDELENSENSSYEKYLNFEGNGYVLKGDVEQLRRTINYYKIFAGVHFIDDPNTDYDDYKDYLVAEIFGKALYDWNNVPNKYTLSTMADIIMDRLKNVNTTVRNKDKCVECIKYILHEQPAFYTRINEHLDEVYYNDNEIDDKYDFRLFKDDKKN